MNETEPNGPFAAMWLGHALTAVEAHPRFALRCTMLKLAPWIAANVEDNGTVCAKLQTTARATSLTRTQIRSTYRELQRAGFVIAQFRRSYDGKELPTLYTLTLPASVVDAELEAMASAEALASLETHV